MHLRGTTMRTDNNRNAKEVHFEANYRSAIAVAVWKGAAVKVKKVCGNCGEFDGSGCKHSADDCMKNNYKHFKPSEEAKEQANPELYNLIGWVDASVKTHLKTLPKKFIKEMGEILNCAESSNELDSLGGGDKCER